MGLWKEIIELGQNLQCEKDGSAAAGARPRESRAGRRTSRRPPACIRSRTDRNGRPTEGRGRSTVYRPAALRLRTLASFDDLVHFPFQAGESRLQRAATRVYDDFPPRGQLRQVAAKRFTNPALDPVSDRGLPKGTRHRKADPCGRAHRSKPRPRQTEHRKTRTRNPKAPLIDLPILGRPEQPGALRKGEPAWWQRKRCSVDCVTWRTEPLSRH